MKVTPLRNTTGSGYNSDRVDSINAFDHPDDDGTAIDVIWSISDADDFATTLCGLLISRCPICP